MRATGLLLASTLSLAGCAGEAPRARPEEIRGPRLTQAIPKPDFVLQKLDGSRFDFRRETEGKLTFLFFGYTHCPDVCPLHMSNLAWAVHTLPPRIAASIRVVFVTTDPERDTPDRLRSWLAQFDSSFVGVRGGPAELEAAQRAARVPVAVREGDLPSGAGYGMTHGAQMWAFTPDDSAHVAYPWGLKREDLAADIPKLLEIWPAPGRN